MTYLMQIFGKNGTLEVCPVKDLEWKEEGKRPFIGDKDKDTNCVVCSRDEADFFGVYFTGANPNDVPEWVVDFETEIDANTFCSALTELLPRILEGGPAKIQPTPEQPPEPEPKPELTSQTKTIALLNLSVPGVARTLVSALDCAIREVEWAAEMDIGLSPGQDVSELTTLVQEWKDLKSSIEGVAGLNIA